MKARLGALFSCDAVYRGTPSREAPQREKTIAQADFCSTVPRYIIPEARAALSSQSIR